MASDLVDSAVGALLGTLVGDALGMPGEGLSREELGATFGQLEGYLEGRLPAGEFTDDAEMTLSVAESLVERGAFDQKEVARVLADNFTPWRGYSPHVYGIMARIRQGFSWAIPGVSHFSSDAAVRCAPLAVLYADDPDLVDHAVKLAEITDVHPNGLAGAVVQSLAVSFAVVNGLFESSIDRDDLLERLHRPVSDHSVAMADALARIRDVQMPRDPRALPAAIGRVFACDGGAVTTVPAALAAFVYTTSFESAVVTAVNCGGDTDTLGAMTGALAGSFYGAASIPERLLAGLSNEKRGRDFARDLGQRLGEVTRKRSGKRLEFDDLE
jgi:poly(ADP-ribose) glycohydrolase ARH3